MRVTAILSFVLVGLVACRASRSAGASDGGAASVGSGGAGPAAAPKGIVIERAAYQLTYPDTWKLDDKDEDFDLDNYFSIDAPGSCHVQFFLYRRGVDEATGLAAQVDKMKTLFKAGVRETPFTTWGALKGSGSELVGRMAPVGKARVRVFVHGDPVHSITVNEFCFDEDLAAAQPGFDLVERSFRFR